MINLKKITQFILTANLFVMLLFTQAIVLTFANQFKLSLVILSVIISLILSVVFFSFIKRDLKLFPVLTVPAILIVLLVSLILIFFPHDTFGGRDESIYSNLAVSLANRGSLDLPSHLNNLPDNFIEGMRRMEPGYPIWLAIQKILFGNEWLLRSNLVLIALGLCSLFLTGSLLGGKLVGLITIALFSSSMPFLWFSRETMTENLSFFLLWTLILFFLLFFRTRRLIYLLGVFFGSWLFAITRFEGFLMQFSLILAFVSVAILFKNFSWKKILGIVFICLFFICSNFFFFNRAYNQVYSGYIKDILPMINYQIKTNVTTLPLIQNVNQTKETKLINEMPMFFILMLTKYNLVIVLFSIFLLIPLIAIGKKLNTITKIYLIGLLILISPEFYKFINPRVTLDQPWLYRRYLYALLPFGYLCLSILLNQFKRRKFLIVVFSCLFITNIILSKDIIFLKNNWPLINKMEEITKIISQNDYIIIRNWTLNYYCPASFLIIQKGIRSSFSSVKISEYLPQQKIINGVSYNKLYLLSNKENEKYPNFRVIEKDSIKLQYEQLKPSCELYMLGEYLRLYNSYDSSIIPYSETIKYCGQPGNEIIKHSESLYLYELIYEAH